MAFSKWRMGMEISLCNCDETNKANNPEINTKTPTMTL